jgi:glycosyltransferase involved in cell wall biosynthesis
MKIAIDCRMSGMSGIGIYLDNILAYLISKNLNNTYFLIGDKSKLECYEHYPKCQILHTEIPIFSIKEMFGFPTKEINKCDVFYSPNYNIPFGINIPIYATIHDVVFLDVKGLTSKIGKVIRWIALWRVIKISKKIFTVSNFSKSRIQFHFKKTPLIIVANSGINSDLKEFKVKDQSPYIFQYLLFIGNIKKHKGLNILLQAYDKAHEKGITHKLVIVGDYENFKTVDADIINRINPQSENVVFTGKIANEQLYNTIAHASLLVQPSVYEGFGLPPLEALYLGCNALISDIPVFREIDGKLPVTFFEVNNIVDLAEKIIQCIKNNPPQLSVNKDIDKLYSLERSAQLILNQLKI